MREAVATASLGFSCRGFFRFGNTRGRAFFRDVFGYLTSDQNVDERLSFLRVMKKKEYVHFRFRHALRFPNKYSVSSI